MRTHRSAAVLSVGDELTLGQTLDTNAQRISAWLLERGVRTVEHVTVDDDLPRLTDAFRRLLATADLVVCSGGLGPTADDLTRAALAAATGDTLIEDAAALDAVRAWYAGRDRPMPEANRVQALRPTRGVCVENTNGTAPGIWLAGHESGRADCLCLPGPPRELVPMMQRELTSRLRTTQGAVVRTRVLGTFGIGESAVAERLGKLMDRARVPLIGTTASVGGVSVRMRCEGDLSAEAAEAALDADERVVRDLLDPHVFTSDGASMLEALISELEKRRERVVTVESCSGGLLGAWLSETPGSSEI